jgi:hypothetical protein
MNKLTKTYNRHVPSNGKITSYNLQYFEAFIEMESRARGQQVPSSQHVMHLNMDN